MKTTEPLPPTAEALEAALGKRYKLFDRVLESHPELSPEWKYYGAKYGWTMKLFEKKRNLCFITARDGELRIAFLLSDAHVDAVLSSTLPERIKDELRKARRYAEGRGISLAITKPADLKLVEEILRIKRTVARPTKKKSAKTT